MDLQILSKWTLLEKSLRSLLRSLVAKSLIDNIFVERLGFRGKHCQHLIAVMGVVDTFRLVDSWIKSWIESRVKFLVESQS